MCSKLLRYGASLFGFSRCGVPGLLLVFVGFFARGAGGCGPCGRRFAGRPGRGGLRLTLYFVCCTCGKLLFFFGSFVVWRCFLQVGAVRGRGGEMGGDGGGKVVGGWGRLWCWFWFFLP